MGILSELFGGGNDTSEQYEKAGSTYQSWMEKALAQLKESYGQGRGDITGYLNQALGYGQPYRQAGQEALGAYEGTLGLGTPEQRQQALTSFRKSPGYQFALQQGLKSAQYGAAGAGLTGSGAEQRELQRTGQGLANQEYGSYQTRLANLAGMGAQESNLAAQMAYGAGGQLAGLGERYGQGAAGIYGDIGKTLSEQQLAEAIEKQKERSNFWQTIGSIGGGIGGAIFGGAPGAAIGSKIGGAL